MKTPLCIYINPLSSQNEGITIFSYPLLNEVGIILAKQIS